MINKPSVLKNAISILILVLTFPIFLYGWVNHLLAFQLPLSRARKVKDEIFHTSFIFVLTMLTFPIFYLLQTAAVWVMFSGWIAVGYFISLPLSAVVAWKWKNLYKKTVLNLRKIRFFNSHKAQQANELLSNIMQKTNDLIEAFLR